MDTKHTRLTEGESGDGQNQISSLDGSSKVQNPDKKQLIAKKNTGEEAQSTKGRGRQRQEVCRKTSHRTFKIKWETSQLKPLMCCD